MKEEFNDALFNGEFIYQNEFHTNRGTYLIKIFRHEGMLYIFKYKNGKIVECNNLSKMKKIKQ